MTAFSSGASSLSTIEESTATSMWPQGAIDTGVGAMWELGLIDGPIMWPQTQWPYVIYVIIPFDGCIIIFDKIDFIYSKLLNTDFDYAQSINLNFNQQEYIDVDFEYLFISNQTDYTYILDHILNFSQNTTIDINFNYDEILNLDFEVEPDQGQVDITLITDFEGIIEYDTNFAFNINFSTDFNHQISFDRIDFCNV